MHPYEAQRFHFVALTKYSYYHKEKGLSGTAGAILMGQYPLKSDQNSLKTHNGSIAFLSLFFLIQWGFFILNIFYFY